MTLNLTDLFPFRRGSSTSSASPSAAPQTPQPLATPAHPAGARRTTASWHCSRSSAPARCPPCARRAPAPRRARRPSRVRRRPPSPPPAISPPCWPRSRRPPGTCRCFLWTIVGNDVKNARARRSPPPRRSAASCVPFAPCSAASRRPGWHCRAARACANRAPAPRRPRDPSKRPPPPPDAGRWSAGFRPPNRIGYGRARRCRATTGPLRQKRVTGREGRITAISLRYRNNNQEIPPHAGPYRCQPRRRPPRPRGTEQGLGPLETIFKMRSRAPAPGGDSGQRPCLLCPVPQPHSAIPPAIASGGHNPP